MIRASRTAVLAQNGTNGRTGKLTVPAELMTHLTTGAAFQVELNDDGILFRPLVNGAPEELPEWLTPTKPARKRG